MSSCARLAQTFLFLLDIEAKLDFCIIVLFHLTFLQNLVPEIHVLVSLCSIMDLFGVLKYKKMGEDFVRNSGLPFTIIRAGRLTDGPYTSYDLNTLLRATAGERRAVIIGQGDKLTGEVSRLVVAEACVQALDLDSTEGQTYEINSIKGEGPGSDPQKWEKLFKAAEIQ